MQRIFGYVWGFYFSAIFIALLLLLYPFFILTLASKKTYNLAFLLFRFWSKLLLFLTLIRPKVSWEEPLEVRPYLICTNHMSYLDVPILFATLPRRFHLVGKSELLKVPLFSLFFKTMHITVDRSNAIRAGFALERAGRDLEDGVSIGIMPEGTIPHDTPKLGQFKDGAFNLAIERQVPILPVVFLDNHRRLPFRESLFPVCYPGRARIVVKKSIQTDGLTASDRQPLKQKLWNLMNDELQKGV